MEWYYAKDGKQEGPVSAAQLRQLASAGKLDPTDMVFKIGTKDWVEASTVSGLFAAGAAPPATAPASFAFGGEGEKIVTSPARRKSHPRDRAEVEEKGDEDAPPSRSTRKSSSSMGDVIMFRRMVAPWVIMVLFWLGVAGAVLVGLIILVMGMLGKGIGMAEALVGLISIPINILLVRLYCELMIVIFRMNETLTDIKNSLERPRNP